MGQFMPLRTIVLSSPVHDSVKSISSGCLWKASKNKKNHTFFDQLLLTNMWFSIYSCIFVFNTILFLLINLLCVDLM